MDYLILLSSILLGVVTVFAFKLHEPQHVKLFNAFTGAFLLSLTLLHLLPELFHLPEGSGEHYAMLLGALMLGGFFVQLALDFISMGIEHGHAHHLHGHAPYGVVAGLCVHAFVEAMALGDGDSTHDPASRHLLLLSIVVHNYPVSIALLGMLLHWGMTRGKAIGVLGLFAAMAPLGMFLSSSVPFLMEHSRELMAVVIGIFMHIATTILFESGDVHRIRIGKVLAIVLGTALGVAAVLLE
ncbi:MAG TPA: ZIP family metal transporter [Verrucomicrobia bacterium]|mgnify:FL=1|nr:ZIP family metal transporter [Verrucomicrobiota bacterium]HOP96573.1 ZIP family metal transporter [Verrucomicrobiota bacterium]